MLIGDMLPEGDMMLWYALAVSSTLAGNATLIGSAANVIVSEHSEKEGISFNFWKFALIGVPMTFVTLLIAIGIFTFIG
jgi:Na+/H+ antiporter NhaD/arsenite permease-like protein